MQTGGTGLTWKRYARPVSPLQGTDNKYHGLISIPGFGAQRNILDAITAGGIRVTVTPDPNASLSLGYVDDNYGDNGYWSHDDGLWQQCNDLPDAWVVVAIQHNCALSASPACIQGRALDLVADTFDQNGFPVNPTWVWTRLVGSPPDPKDVCSWSSKTGTNKKDDASLCATATQRDSEWYCVQGTTPGAIAGHMNWTNSPVTNVGYIASPSYDKYDSEYTFDSSSTAKSLYLSTQSLPQIEFDTRETIDRVSSTYTQGVEGVLKDTFLHGADAITIGLLGLDCGHTCNTEFHPAFAFFVHTKTDPDDDTWAFFIKNFGNEGFCGSQEHTIATQEFTLRLSQPSATDVSLNAQTLVGATNSVTATTFSYVPDPLGGGAYFHFSLPPPSAKGVILGELHLHWTIPLDQMRWDDLWAQALAAGLSRTDLEALSHEQTSPQVALHLQDMIKQSKAVPATPENSEEPSLEEQVTTAVAAQPAAFQTSTAAALASFNQVAQTPVHTLTGALADSVPAKPATAVEVQSTSLPPQPAVDALRSKLIQLISKATQ